MNPLDKLTTIIAKFMGKEPSDPDVLEAVVEVVMAMREPDAKMLDDGLEAIREARSARFAWYAMIDALLTEGG